MMQFWPAPACASAFTKATSTSQVLRGVDFAVTRGETLAIVGASGSGKSTLLHLLGGLERRAPARVQPAGPRLHDDGRRGQGRWRNPHLGFVYQFHHLLPEFSALDNVAMPLRIRAPSRARGARDARPPCWPQVGLARRVRHRPSAALGRRAPARGDGARAGRRDPACVLADEPTGNLDRDTADGVFALMLDLAREHGTAFVLVTHDERWRRAARACCDSCRESSAD